jgi:hypothetical protein
MGVLGKRRLGEARWTEEAVKVGGEREFGLQRPPREESGIGNFHAQSDQKRRRLETWADDQPATSFGIVSG